MRATVAAMPVRVLRHWGPNGDGVDTRHRSDRDRRPARRRLPFRPRCRHRNRSPRPRNGLGGARGRGGSDRVRFHRAGNPGSCACSPRWSLPRSPPAVDGSEIGSFVEAADRVGIARVACLSALGAERNVLVSHHRIEKRIVVTDMECTLLRASYFVHLLEVHRRDVVERDEMFVPAEDGKTDFMDARHIGDAAAVVLTESGHADRASDLTDPKRLDHEEVATVFIDVLDRSISYPNPSPVTFARRMRARERRSGLVRVSYRSHSSSRRSHIRARSRCSVGYSRRRVRPSPRPRGGSPRSTACGRPSRRPRAGSS